MADRRAKKELKLQKEERIRKTKELLFISIQELNSVSPDHVFDLEYSPRDLIRFWLQGIFPPAVNMDIRLNLENKMMVGKPAKCRQKIKQISNELKENKMKKLEGIQLTYNRCLHMEKLFGCHVYDKNDILEAARDMIETYDSKDVQSVSNMVSKAKFFYLICISHIFDQKFVEYMEKINLSQPQPTRGQIKNAQKQHLTLMKQCNKKKSSIKKIYKPKESESQESSQSQSSSSSSEDLQSEEKIQKEQPKKNKKKYQIKEQKGSKTQHHNESQLKKLEQSNDETQNIVLSQTYPRNIFDLDNFQSWVKNNKVLRLSDFSYYLDAEEKNIIVRIYDTDKRQKKLKSIEIYLKHIKLIAIKKNINSNIKQIQAKFCQNKPEQLSYLKCQIVRGYISPNYSQYTLRSKVVSKQIEQSYINTQPFVALFIVGLKSVVDNVFAEATNFIRNLPDDDFVDMIEISYHAIGCYLTDHRVKNFVENQLRNYIQEFQYIQLKSLSCQKNWLRLKLKIQNTELEEYKQSVRQTLVQFFTQRNYIQKIQIDKEDLNKSLLEQFLVFPSKSESNTYIFIASKQKAMNTYKQITKVIMDQNKHTQKQLKAKKSSILKIKQKYKDFIRQLGNKEESVTINFAQNAQSITLSGPKKNVEAVSSFAEQIIKSTEQSLREQIIYLSLKEAKVIKKEELKHKEYIENKYNSTFELFPEKKYGTVITLSQENVVNLDAPLVILQVNAKDFSNLPDGTHVFFKSQDNLNMVNYKGLQNLKDKVRFNNKQFIFSDKYEGITFVYTEGFNKKTQIKDFLEYCKIEKTNHFAFFMPKYAKQKKQFVLELVKIFQIHLQKQNEKYRIYLFKNEGLYQKKIDIESCKKTEIIVSKKIKYYVSDGGQKYYYSETGNTKINEGISFRANNVILYGADINHTSLSHRCSMQDKSIVHTLTEKKTPIKIYPDKITFVLEGKQFQFPESQFQKAMKHPDKSVTISLGVYQIDLIKKIQKNMFSGYERNLYEQVVEEQFQLSSNLNICQQYRGGQIRIVYDKTKEKNLLEIKNYIKKILQSQVTVLNKNLQEKLNQTTIQKINQQAAEDDIEVNITNNEIILKGYDAGMIKKFQKLLPTFINPPLQIRYPQCWEPQQNDIQLFLVPKESEEYKKIATSFNSSSNLEIYQLYRIQNRIIYRRYIEEKQNLKRLNNIEQIKEMMLYHGTSYIDPKVIYEDKEECFNVNYSSDSNFLGRGTYFAETAKYSTNYSYTYQKQSQLSREFHGMMYCSVIVGDSQIIEKIDKDSKSMKDTNVKNKTTNLKYQSATTFTNGSNIYAVYRSKRAYPCYLIKF